MPKNFGRYDYHSRALDRRNKVNRDAKGACNVCGQSADIFHDTKKCAEAWLKEQDAKGNPSLTRTKP